MEWRYDACWSLITRGMEKEAEESARKQSSEIDVHIMEWIISALGDDISLEKFFQTIPGLFRSGLVDIPKNFPQKPFSEFWPALDTFIKHTKISKSVSKKVKSRRLNIAIDITQLIPFTKIRYLLVEGISDNYDSEPVSIDRLQRMGQWIDHWSPFIFCAARVWVANMLARMEDSKRDDRWFKLAHKVSLSSLWEYELRLAHVGDNMLLSAVIDACRQMFRFPGYRFLGDMLTFFRGFDNFDICRALPRLQHDFCELWNELVQDARHLTLSGPSSSQQILLWIHRHYNYLHEGTDAALNDHFISAPQLYPRCNISSHCHSSLASVPIAMNPSSTHSGHSSDASHPSHDSTSGDNIVSRRNQESNTAGSPSQPDPTTPPIIRENSGSSAATDSESALQVHTSSHPSDASRPSTVATAPGDVSPVAMVSYTLRGTARSAPAAATSDATSDPLLPNSYVINLSITAVPVQSRVPSPCADSITLPRTTTSIHPTDNTSILRLPARGLVNTGGVCFSNAVLQLLAHTLTFWDAFRELGDLKGRLGAEDLETAAPLVDATMRFFKEFALKEKKPPPTQKPPQQAVREIPREDEEEKEHSAVDSFEPTYIYVAMKEKTQLKDLLVRSRDQDAPFYH